MDSKFTDWLKNWPGTKPEVKTEETQVETQNAAPAAAAPQIVISADDFKTLLKKVATLEARVGTLPSPDPVPAGFEKLACRNCSKEFPADHANPHEGGCQGVASQSHDFYGV